MKIKLLIFFLILIICSCDPMDKRLIIYNYSNKAICVDVAQDTFLSFPDINSKHVYLMNKIEPNSSKAQKRLGSSYAWDDFINKSKNNKVSIFIFYADEIENKNWDTLRKNNLYVKRFDLSVEQMYKMNWVVLFDNK